MLKNFGRHADAPPKIKTDVIIVASRNGYIITHGNNRPIKFYLLTRLSAALHRMSRQKYLLGFGFSAARAAAWTKLRKGPSSWAVRTVYRGNKLQRDELLYKKFGYRKQIACRWQQRGDNYEKLYVKRFAVDEISFTVIQAGRQSQLITSPPSANSETFQRTWLRVGLPWTVFLSNGSDSRNHSLRMTW